MEYKELAEEAIQQKIVTEFRNRHCLVTSEPRSLIAHVPNQNQHRLVKIGVYPGFSDLFAINLRGLQGEELKKVLDILRKHLIFAEIKVPGEDQLPSQKKFQAHIEQMGLRYNLVYSLEDWNKLVYGEEGPK